MSLPENFGYDLLDRLTSVSGDYTAAYAYNALANIVSSNVTGTYKAYGYGTKPHAVTSVGAAGYTYDSNGNMLTRSTDNITWDAENRPVTVSTANGTSTFVYDGDGNRVKKSEGGQDILYINKFFERNLTSSENTTYYYLGDKMAALRKATDNLTYVYQDHLTGTAVTDNGTVSTISFMPFGATRSGDVPTDKKFTGQRLDGTGLYYYGARFYDPDIGRFISADTIVPNPANPQSLNRYSYVLNNPMKYVDPTGHDEEVGSTEVDGQTYTIIKNDDGTYRLSDGNGGSSGSGTLQQLLGMIGGYMNERRDYGIGGNASIGPVITFNWQTGLMWQSIPVHYVPEGFVGQWNIPGKALSWLGPPGITLDFAGGAFVRYQNELLRDSAQLYRTTMHEAEHYFEQRLAGALGLRGAWYGAYGAEYGIRYLGSRDSTLAHNTLLAERRAEAFADNPSQKFNMVVGFIVNIILIVGR